MIRKNQCSGYRVNDVEGDSVVSLSGMLEKSMLDRVEFVLLGSVEVAKPDLTGVGEFGSEDRFV